MEGMNCLCHYDGVIENEDGKPKYTGGEARLRYIRRDVAFSHFVRMMEDLCGNKNGQTSISMVHIVFGVASTVKDAFDYEAMFAFYESNPQQPLRIWITKRGADENTATTGGIEEQLICLPKLVDNLTSHRHSRKTSKTNLTGKDNIKDTVLSTRDALPAQFIFTIKSFSSLSKNSIEKYECVEFESAGYKWKLSLYPNGNKTEKAKDHISLYLVMAGTDSLPSGWEVDVAFRFFLFDHLSGKYVTIKGDSEGRFRRFHASKMQWGFSHLMPLTTFKDPSKGYLVNDTSIFGADIFVSKSLHSGKSVVVVKDDITGSSEWNIDSYSTKKNEKYLMSNEIIAGGHKWHVRLYPNYQKGYMSLYLYLDSLAPQAQKVYAMFVLRLRDQKGGKHVEFQDACWFDMPYQYGGRDFYIRTDVLENPANGFLVKDTCIIDAEIILA